MKTLNVVDLGILPYEETYLLQKSILEEKKKRNSADVLLLVEHPNVLTIGKRGSRDNILTDESVLKDNGVDVIDVDRGGDITFHGIGQLVAYPIFDLKGTIKDIRLFIRNFESVLEMTLAEYGLRADSKKDYTGVWVNGQKIGFVGIGVSSWITYHGISLNANVDLSYFSMIRPCGIDGLKVTSLSQILKRKIDIAELKDIVSKRCKEVFGFESPHNNSKDAVMVKEKAF